jgi:hypothetical protein
MKLGKVMIGNGTLRKNRLITKKENCIEHMDRFLAGSALTKEEKRVLRFCKNLTVSETNVFLFSKYGAATKKVSVAPET